MLDDIGAQIDIYLEQIDKKQLIEYIGNKLGLILPFQQVFDSKRSKIIDKLQSKLKEIDGKLN